jgi:hypothetical protein
MQTVQPFAAGFAEFAAGVPPALPQALEPWRVWLTLFPDDLMLPVGNLLLQLQPLVGQLNCAVPQAERAQIGVGSIVRRGAYERMLLSEWAYADAAPDEFIRRAASAELLFTGPEPAKNRQAQTVIALFDSGPMQLGAPRIGQLALFILLARRAAQAKAQFVWGSLQHATVLHEGTTEAGIRALLSSRTLTNPDANCLAQWNAHLATLGQSLTDCWTIGHVAVNALARSTANVTITQPLGANALRVLIKQRRNTRDVTLDLPASNVAIRLIRDPFVTASATNKNARAGGKLSLMQPPRFAQNGQRIAVALLDGGATVFHIPQSPRASPGKSRRISPPKAGTILAASIYKHGLATIISNAEKLEFKGFPGRYCAQPFSTNRPAMEQFRAPSGSARWLKVIFLAKATVKVQFERIFALDIAKNLVYWKLDANSSQTNVPMTVLGNNIVGLAQVREVLVYACATTDLLEIFVLPFSAEAPRKILSLMCAASTCFFGDPPHYLTDNGWTGALAIQLAENTWWVGSDLAGITSKNANNGALKTDSENIISIAQGSTVLGVTRTNSMNTQRHCGLIVLDKSRKNIVFQSHTTVTNILKTETPIVHASFDFASGNLAWTLANPHSLTVRHFASDKKLLHINFDGDDSHAG